MSAPRCCIEDCSEEVVWQRRGHSDSACCEFLCASHLALLAADSPAEAKCFGPLLRRPISVPKAPRTPQPSDQPSETKH